MVPWLAVIQIHSNGDKDLLKKIFLSTMPISILLRCAVIINPAVENTRSAATAVPWMAIGRLASLAKWRSERARDLHHRRELSFIKQDFPFTL